MPNRDKEASATPLTDARVTAKMTAWMLVDCFGEECLFGFAELHPNTGGLSWVLSTPVVEFSATVDRARTQSGRVYALGRLISSRELDEEGRVALRLLLPDDQADYPGRADDVAWVVARKMARHLGETAPLRTDPFAVERFLRRHMSTYLRYRRGLSSG
jgi:hypothetical protein